MDILKVITSNINNNYLISASAGTGKTYTITKYYMSILENNVGNNNIIESILAVTFTNKAANEMKERIIKSVYEKKEKIKNTKSKEYKYWDNISLEISRAWIKTIDSFCSKLLRENNILIGIDPNFTMINDFRKERELEKSVQFALKLIFDITENRNLDWLNNLSKKRQKNINRYINNLKEININEYLITMIKEIGLETFEIMILEVLKNWRIEMAESQLIEKIDFNDSNKSKFYSKILFLFKNVCLIAIEFFESITLDNFQFDFKGILEKTYECLKIDDIRTKYSKKFKYIIVDEFQDTNHLQKKIFYLMKNDNNYLFFVGDKKQSIYRFRGADISVFSNTIDEFKKSNSIIGSLNVNRRSNNSIVEFANIISKDILFNKNYFNDDYVDEILMDNLNFNNTEDYCKYEIEEKDSLVPTISENDKNRIKYIHIKPEKDNSECRTIADIDAIVKSISNLVGKKMNFRIRKRDQIVFEKRKIKFGDICVLLKQMRGYENIIKEKFKEYNIPYYIFGSRSFYYRPEIKAIFNALNAIQNPLNDYEFIKYMMSMMVRMKFEDLQKLINNKNDFDSLYENFDHNKALFSEEIVKGFNLLKKYKNLKYFLNPGDILKSIIDESHFIPFLTVLDESDTSISNVKKLISEADKFDNLSNSFSELIKLLKKSTEIDEEEAVLEDESSDSVKIMTIHKSKGLEFPVVLLGGLHKNIDRKNKNNIEFSIPDINGNFYFILNNLFEEELNNSKSSIIKWFKNNEFLERTENNRLIYVAITRAKDMLLPILVESNKITFNNFFKNLKYDYIDNINVEDLNINIIEKKHEIKNESPINKKNLKDLTNLSYKQYIAPTFLIREIKTSELKLMEEFEEQKIINYEYNKYNELFKDKDNLIIGEEIHNKLQSCYKISDIKYLINKKILPEKFDEIDIIKIAFDNNINQIIKNEWRLMKNYKIKTRNYMLFGIPDKVLIKDNKIHVIDFKYSELNNKKKINDYIFQVMFYLYLLKDFGEAYKGYIISLKNNKVIEFDYNNNIEKEIKKWINNMEEKY